MLEEVLRYINNRFDADGNGVPYGSVEGVFTISSGAVDIAGLADGQWFWIEGSALNDGLHVYRDTDLADETFEGRAVFLRVPLVFVELADEVAAWNEANAGAIDSPLQSESFGGYSYTRASGGAQGNETPAAAWQLHFGARLRPYRKFSRDWV